MDRSIWILITIGSTVGGLIPYIWGGGTLSTIVFGSIGALVAIWINFKLNH